MHVARTLLLGALAALTLSTTGANAQSVEVQDEQGFHCNEVVEASHDISGGCKLHLTGDFTWFVHTGVAEMVTTTCETELWAHLNEDGNGYFAIDDTSIHTNIPAGCPITPCDEPATKEHEYKESRGEAGPEVTHPEPPWPISATYEVGGGEEELVFTFCLRAESLEEGATGGVCTLSVHIDENEATHQQVLEALEDPCHENPGVEFTGTWIAEEPHNPDEEDEIEIEHIHYPTSDNP